MKFNQTIVAPRNVPQLFARKFDNGGAKRGRARSKVPNAIVQHAAIDQDPVKNKSNACAMHPVPGITNDATVRLTHKDVRESPRNHA